jgi:hypothetical protein
MGTIVQEVGVAVKVPPAVKHITHQACDKVALPFLPRLGVCHGHPDGRDISVGGDATYYEEV